MNKLVPMSQGYLRPPVWARQFVLGRFTLRLSLSRDKEDAPACPPFPLSNCVRLLRLERGLSCQELACMLGVHTSTLCALESGSYQPSLELAMRLSMVFDLPIEAIFSRSPASIHHPSERFPLLPGKGESYA